MNYSNLTNKQLLELQKKFRRNLIKEEEIPKDVVKDLEILYKKQIDYLNNKIKQDKEQILKIRKKMKL